MRAMIDLFKMLRPVNLLLVVIMLAGIKYGLLETNGVATALDDLHFALLVIATMCVTGAGNVINDIEDQDIDRINRPHRVLVKGNVSTKSAFRFYLLLNLIGVGLGFYLANQLERPGLGVIFIIVSGLLYYYSNQLSSTALMGNLSVSFLVAICVLLPVLFDIFPAIQPQGMSIAQGKASALILIFAGYAFYITLVRELVKDILDIDGDYAEGRRTLPIIMGRDRSRWFAFWMMLLLLLATLAIAYTFDRAHQNLALFVLFCVGGLMLTISIQLYHAKRPKDLKLISNLLKALLFMGLLGLILFPDQLMTL